MTVPFPDLEQECEFFDEHFQPVLEVDSPMMRVILTKSGSFSMPPSRFRNVEAWTHEFSEYVISMCINECGHNPFQEVRLPDEQGIWNFTLCHMLTMLSCGTSTRFDITSSESFVVTTPEDEWQYVKERLKNYDRLVSLIRAGRMGAKARREWEKRES